MLATFLHLNEFPYYKTDALAGICYFERTCHASMKIQCYGEGALVTASAFSRTIEEKGEEEKEKNFLVADLLRCCFLIRDHSNYLFIHIHEAYVSLFVGHFTINWDNQAISPRCCNRIARRLLCLQKNEGGGT